MMSGLAIDNQVEHLPLLVTGESETRSSTMSLAINGLIKIFTKHGIIIFPVNQASKQSLFALALGEHTSDLIEVVANVGIKILPVKQASK